ncbi:MAG TPA: tRNA (N(6)-L-threonylcarbamoyladenosine(37)-C(2))-methylthiotransferase MtaB [Ktedonobacteraceae bacterium]|nr:tRNA (N(6)-L-threonylcarbamoyladenosine(37)-C(2))-methylthiotransferase MtaB [Ktedonobacteraceae bacterium]
MTNQSTSEKTFAIATLGCKVNQADSEAISEQMSAAGFVQCDFSDMADIYIVNTCTVTHLGDRSSRQMISQARRRRPDALLVVTGCYAEINPKAVSALPGVDFVVGNLNKSSLVDSIITQLKASPSLDSTFHPKESTDAIKTNEQRRILPVFHAENQHIGSDVSLPSIGVDQEPQPDNPSGISPVSDLTRLPAVAHSRHITRTRVQMKVQDGCDNRCTYCIVPYVRGGSRSRSIESVVEHVQRKTRAGFQEIVLTGIHLGDYHPDTDKKRDLGDLISALLDQTGISRIRVSSLEPEDFRLEWLELWKNPRMCRHLHLPMQSGSDRILRRMARRYHSERYRQIVRTAKQCVPGMAISTDIITGFPGESESDFEETYQLATELQFAKAHIFRFSPRQGTAAARMQGQVKEEIKKARSERLLALNEQDVRRFRQQFLGETVQVLLESYKHGRWEGLTDNYLRVEVDGLPDPTNENWQNTLVKAHLTQMVDDGVLGNAIEYGITSERITIEPSIP